MAEANGSELSPAELDRIEDALEGLEHADALDEHAPIVRRRLEAYREVLQLSRTALPMQEVPAGLIDGVLEQARQLAESDTVAEPPLPARRGWWARWRTTLLVPGLAMATAAAVVLIIGQSREGAPPEIIARAEPVAEVPDKAMAAPGSPPASAAMDERVQTAAPAQEPPAEEASAQDAEREDTPADEPAPSRDEGTASPRWDIIARGDRARRAADCKQASAEYAMALTDDDVHVRARAYAGLGLCDATEGRFKEAADRYQRAKELDPNMESFIEDERPRGSTGGGGNATRAKRAAPASSKTSSKAKPLARPSVDPKSKVDAFGE
jgi:tetratricopeptide (TPR) repeat protein